MRRIPLIALESHFLHSFVSCQVRRYPVATFTMVRTKQTKRKPVHKPKKDWGTAELMIQKPILNLPGHPTQNRPDYSGMYTVL